MQESQLFLINSIFGWMLVALSVAGYFVTLKKIKQKWMAWLLMAFGWGFFAAAQTLLIAMDPAPINLIIGLWLSSFVMVILAITLLFLKLVEIRRESEANQKPREGVAGEK